MQLAHRELGTRNSVYTTPAWEQRNNAPDYVCAVVSARWIDDQHQVQTINRRNEARACSRATKSRSFCALRIHQGQISRLGEAGTVHHEIPARRDDLLARLYGMSYIASLLWTISMLLLLYTSMGKPFELSGCTELLERIQMIVQIARICSDEHSNCPKCSREYSNCLSAFRWIFELFEHVHRNNRIIWNIHLCTFVLFENV